MRHTTLFRNLINQGKILILPGCYDCIGAKVIENLGYEAVYVSGAAASATRLGLPDIGLATMTEVIDYARNIASSVDLPVFSDADTGYGNFHNVARTVREFERANLAGIHIEDQVTPKKCGQYEGKRLVPTEEMVEKLKAASDARRDQDFVIMARVDAIPVTGFEDALDRAHAYLEAGADLVWMESTRSLDQIKTIGATFGRQAFHNIDWSGRSPSVTVNDLESFGFAVAAFCGASMYAVAWAIREQMRLLLETGDLKRAGHLMMPWHELQDGILGLSSAEALELKYGSEAGGVRRK